MTWTVEKLEQIPEVYRDFMRTLKPVIDTRAPEAVMKITGVPFGWIYEKFSDRHDYDMEQVEQVAQALIERGLVRKDKWGFVTPTERGEDLIRALADAGEAVGQRVPPLPEF
jgi:hypothetical protein